MGRWNGSSFDDVGPPMDSIFRCDDFVHCRRYTRGQGVMGAQDQGPTCQVGCNVNALGGSFCALSEDSGVALCIEVETLRVLSETVVINGSGAKPPVQRMQFEATMWNRSARVPCQEHQYRNRLNVSDVARDHWDGERAQEVVGGEPGSELASVAGDAELDLGGPTPGYGCEANVPKCLNRGEGDRAVEVDHVNGHE